MGSWIRVSDEERAGRRYIRSPIGLALSDTGHLACFIFYSFCKKQIIFYIIILVSQSCPTLCNPMDCSPPGSSVLGDSLGKKTGVGCHFLFQEIFLTQGFNLCLSRLLHWQGSWPLAPPEKPRPEATYLPLKGHEFFRSSLSSPITTVLHQVILVGKTPL